MQPSELDPNLKIISRLGEGGFGEVYLATQQDLDRRVAVKILRKHAVDDPQLQQRFEREAKVLSTLSHPNIVQIYRYGFAADGSPFICTEFIEGSNLSVYVGSHGPLNLQMVQSIANQIGGALGYAHKLGLVHRDIKPANVMIRPDGTAKLLDFGLVRLCYANAEQQKLTAPGFAMGSAEFISPEGGRGEELDRRSDIYSLACTLFYCIAGRPPFSSDAAVAVLYMHSTEEVPSFKSLGIDVPASIETAIRSAMSKDAKDRYSTMEDFLFELNADSSLAPPLKRAIARKSMSGAVICSSMAVLITCVAAIGYMNKRAENPDHLSTTPTQDADHKPLEAVSRTPEITATIKWIHSADKRDPQFEAKLTAAVDELSRSKEPAAEAALRIAFQKLILLYKEQNDHQKEISARQRQFDHLRWLDAQPATWAALYLRLAMEHYNIGTPLQKKLITSDAQGLIYRWKRGRDSAEWASASRALANCLAADKQFVDALDALKDSEKIYTASGDKEDLILLNFERFSYAMENDDRKDAMAATHLAKSVIQSLPSSFDSNLRCVFWMEVGRQYHALLSPGRSALSFIEAWRQIENEPWTEKSLEPAQAAYRAYCQLKKWKEAAQVCKRMIEISPSKDEWLKNLKSLPSS